MKKSNKFIALMEQVGRRENIPDEIVKLVTDKIRAEFGGKHISVPGGSKEAAGKRNDRVVRDHKNGVAVPAIMEKYGLSRAAVYRILKK